MSELEKCCGLVIAAGLATGHADTHIDLMEEVLAQCINAGPNVRAQAERIAELQTEVERLRGILDKVFPRYTASDWALLDEAENLIAEFDAAKTPPQEQSNE